MPSPYDVAFEAVRDAVRSQTKSVPHIIVDAIAREAATTIQHLLGKQAQKVARLADAVEAIAKED